MQVNEEHFCKILSKLKYFTFEFSAKLFYITSLKSGCRLKQNGKRFVRNIWKICKTKYNDFDYKRINICFTNNEPVMLVILYIIFTQLVKKNGNKLADIHFSEKNSFSEKKWFD